MPKRKDYISWDEYFMGVAALSALRSKDPSTQVGCCIVDETHRIVSVGYNGFPQNISDDEFPWEREGQGVLDTKYAYVVHSELNAILNAKRSVNGCTLYVTLFPCNECAKAIIQSGIAEVKYQEDKYCDDPKFMASRKMLVTAGVKLTRLEPVSVKMEKKI